MRKIEQLKAALKILASSAPEQEEYLRSIGLFDRETIQGGENVDELGLQFEDAAALARGLTFSMEISESMAGQVKDLSSFLQSLSGGSDIIFWTIDGLRNDSRWEQVRSAAETCLSELELRRQEY